MNTNYNRIKVSDLETNDRDKILKTNSSGELEFSNINTIKADSYNGLDYTQEGKALDARQGQVLKDLITKKVDKVAGSRLITAEEVDKISGIANVITTIKTIPSAVLTTQNATGFVSYINSLNPVLNVQSNEIVKYTTIESGRVFQLNLRGRSFGVGQQAITISDVTEITAFLNNDIKLSNYTSLRNDGNLTNNKVLSTDTNGNLKMYSFASYPAPYITNPIFTFLPSDSGNLRIQGAFFTPTMTVTISGQTVNYVTFISDNEILVNITTNSIEGNFDIILNNGLNAIFYRRLLIVLGTVHIPTLSDWTILNGLPNLDTPGKISLNFYDVACSATCFTIPNNKNFRVYFTLTRSPLGATIGQPHEPAISLVSASDNSIKFAAQVYLNGADINSSLQGYQASTGFIYTGSNSVESFIMNTSPPTFYFERIGTQYRLRDYNTNIAFTDLFSGDLKIRADIRKFDISNIRYIELND